MSLHDRISNFWKIYFAGIFVLLAIIFLISFIQITASIMVLIIGLLLLSYYIYFSSLAEKIYCRAKETLVSQIESEEDKEVDETWELKEISPRVFQLSFGNSYDLGMRFVRFQEYYESPCPDFRGSTFTLLDYMDWYAKANDGVFSYPDDWAGFNVPGWVFREVLDKNKIEDWNQYDEFMLSIINEIRSKIPKDDPDNFYLIGIVHGDEETMDHELAHAFYYVFPEYKKEMNACLDKLGRNSKEVKLMYEWLEKQGYDQSVFDDEAQAYFATGVLEEYGDDCKRQKLDLGYITKGFEEVFARWKANHKKL